MLPKIEEIKIRRNTLGLTQPQLAKLASVSQSLIAKIETGRIKHPSFKKTSQIFKALEEEELNRKTGAKAKDIHNRPVIGVNIHDTILTASQIMRKHDYSQLPVYDDDKVIGSISEEIINNYFSEGKDLDLLSKMEVTDLKGTDSEFPQVDENYPVEPITNLLRHSHAVLTIREGKVVGIITKADLLRLIRS